MLGTFIRRAPTYVGQNVSVQNDFPRLIITSSLHMPGTSISWELGITFKSLAI
mgnify:CR=1 FL=1